MARQGRSLQYQIVTRIHDPVPEQIKRAYIECNLLVSYHAHMASVQNVNPTILAAIDLPTRHPAPSDEAGDNHFGILSTVLPLGNTYDPFDASTSSPSELDSDEAVEPIDEQEIYDLIATISDPEHPLSLGSLAVVNLPDIHISSVSPESRIPLHKVKVLLTPTINHCSLATVIGLGVRVRLEQALPPRYRVDVQIKEGTHSSAEEVNKQLADKERVAAALENRQLWGVLRKMMETCV